MKDLIRKRDAITAAVGAVDEWDGGSNEHRYGMIASAINALPHAQQWIPVSERPPEEFENVLVSWKGQTRGGYKRASEWVIRSESPGWVFTADYDEVDAWMPMPEPYKERG